MILVGGIYDKLTAFLAVAAASVPESEPEQPITQGEQNA
jgi:hypothetical protein